MRINRPGLTYTIRADALGDRVDTDADGFSDEDEIWGTDVDCDGVTDGVTHLSVALGGYHDVPTNPAVPDLYVEVDWMDCALSRPGESISSCVGSLDDQGNPDMRSFEPDWLALDSVVQAFADHGITLHVVPGEAVPVHGVWSPGLGGYALPDVPLDDPDPTIEDGKLVWDLYFGDEEERADPRRLAYRQAHVRYAIFNWGGQGGGYAWEGGDSFRFSIHSNYTNPANDPYDAVLTAFDRHREYGHGFMHELGHCLGLQHGGRDDYAHKPNSFSVMIGRSPRLDDLATSVYDREHDYNSWPNVLDECNLDEDAAIVNSPVEWATSWICPDGFTKQYGSAWGPNDWNCDGQVGGQVHAGTCIDLDPIPCVEPGAANQLSTLPAAGDVVRGGWIEVGADGVLQTSVAVTDQLSINGRIEPGRDGNLESVLPVGSDDLRMGEKIFPGQNRLCDTTVAQPGDVLKGQPSCADPAQIPPCPQEAWDEWAYVKERLPLKGNLSGAYAGPPLVGPVEPTREELEELEQRTARSDVALSSTVATGVGTYGRQVTLDYTVTNFGPHAATLPTLQLTLPADASLVRCQVPGGSCFEHEGMVIAGWEALATNTTGSIQIEVLTDCEAEALEFAAKVHTRSHDPQPANNQTVDEVSVDPRLPIGDAVQPWVKSFAGGQTMPIAQTSAGPALNLTCGYQAFESPAFDTHDLGASGTQLFVDLYIPQASWGSWVGTLDLFFEAPSSNVWNRWLTSLALTPLTRGQWVTVALPLDSVTQAALLDDTPGARFRFASNLGVCGPAIHLANVRLGGTLTCQPPALASESLTSSSVLRFETMADWSSSAGAMASESVAVAEGARALRLGPVPWTRVESRPFATSELSAVSSRFSVEVLIPETPPSTYWVGGLGLLVDCPDAGLHDRWVGYHALQFLDEGDFNRLEFAMPEDVVDVLEGDHDCSFAFELTANPPLGSFVLDGAGFLPEDAP